MLTYLTTPYTHEDDFYFEFDNFCLMPGEDDPLGTCLMLSLLEDNLSEFLAAFQE